MLKLLRGRSGIGFLTALNIGAYEGSSALCKTPVHDLLDRRHRIQMSAGDQVQLDTTCDFELYRASTVIDSVWHQISVYVVS